jgi:hypothetical protein
MEPARAAQFEGTSRRLTRMTSDGADFTGTRFDSPFQNQVCVSLEPIALIGSGDLRRLLHLLIASRPIPPVVDRSQRLPAVCSKCGQTSSGGTMSSANRRDDDPNATSFGTTFAGDLIRKRPRRDIAT